MQANRIAVSRAAGKSDVIEWLKRHPMEMILIVLYVALVALAPNFFTLENQLNVLRNATLQGIIAFGMTMVIVSGEIDLSVGSGAAFAGCVVALVVRRLSDMTGDVVAVLLGCIFAIIALAAAALLSGLLRQYTRVPTFITSLALLTGLFGAANLLTGGFPITPFPDWYGFLGSGYLFGIPFPVYIFVVIFLASHFLMKNTTFGRAIYAVGGNAEAARLSGIGIWRVKTMALIITSVLTALSGILVSSETMAGNASAARGWELDVISAVIIGGTSLFGGRGQIWGTLIGVLFLGIVINGMTLMNVSEYWQYVVRALLILGAVLLNSVMEKSRES
ncbi:branched-chain amino acid transport system / permease component family protein (plasmid) [Burkholderia pseudomallei]|uniref:Branched-chain amino acid transport system / permease component family protein n=1 Tax=Burkholderia pseudomallei TaxID=28450 RepID=A0AA40MF10_BURPE|nr:branched-chain amino acid transport system / permease component family protein [Burkholderia pseudomallei]KGS72510.1 branched-chain amino acid transport system / permease component family protein [Burkholderia pseudomallei MSHR5596]KGX17129.1 branched-chain amino acid transport system / permease component family protein [Burkholderia pseudomallei]